MAYPWIVKTTGVVNHFSVYAVDVDFGAFFRTFCCFLEDARERGVLRTVGSVYQFRHARLQDQLATTYTRPPTTR